LDTQGVANHVQMDIHGSPFGLLAAHPVNALVSLHHLDAYSAIFPDSRTRQEAMAHLVEAAKVDQASLLQQSMCYFHNNHQTWSISVSWGYAVQVYKQYLTPRDLETPLRTFYSCRHKTDKSEFPFNTREPAQDICEQPIVFYMSWVRKAHDFLLESEYKKEKNERMQILCDPELEPLNLIQRIRVTKEPVPDSWFQVTSSLLVLERPCEYLNFHSHLAPSLLVPCILFCTTPGELQFCTMTDVR